MAEPPFWMAVWVVIPRWPAMPPLAAILSTFERALSPILVLNPPPLAPAIAATAISPVLAAFPATAPSIPFPAPLAAPPTVEAATTAWPVVIAPLAAAFPIIPPNPPVTKPTSPAYFPKLRIDIFAFFFARAVCVNSRYRSEGNGGFCVVIFAFNYVIRALLNGMIIKYQTKQMVGNLSS